MNCWTVTQSEGVQTVMAPIAATELLTPPTPPSSRQGGTLTTTTTNNNNNNNMITQDYVCKKCKEDDTLKATYVECNGIDDGCEGGAKVVLLVVSTAFDGLPLLKRHKLVNAVFAEELSNGQIHALTIQAKTPAQYNAAASTTSTATAAVSK